MQITISANGTYSLGDSGVGSVTTKSIQFQASGWTGSIEVRKAKTQQVSPTQTVLTPVVVAIKKEYFNGAVGDNTYGSGPITTSSLIQVDASGGEIFLVVTGYSAGTMIVQHSDLAG